MVVTSEALAGKLTCVWWWHYLVTNQTVVEVYLSSSLHLIVQCWFCTLHNMALPHAMQRQCYLYTCKPS